MFAEAAGYLISLPGGARGVGTALDLRERRRRALCCRRPPRVAPRVSDHLWQANGNWLTRIVPLVHDRRTRFR